MRIQIPTDRHQRDSNPRHSNVDIQICRNIDALNHCATAERNGNLSKLDTSVDKLRIKYKWSKQEWAAKTRRAKNGSGLEPDQEPQWYKVLNPVFAETHRPLNLVSSAMDTSFLNNPALSDDSMNEDDLENLDTENPTDTGNEPASKKTKIVVAPHKKHQQIRSNKQGLSAIARGLNAAIVAQDKRFDRQIKANDERERNGSWSFV